MAEKKIGLQELLIKLIKDTFSRDWQDGINHEGPLPIQDVEDIRYHYERMSGQSWYDVCEETKQWALDTHPIHVLADHDQAAYNIHTEWVERLKAALDEPA